MSNLLVFQERLLEDHTATYSIETAELNPRNKAIDKTSYFSESFELKDFTLRSIMAFLKSNSDNLRTYGYLIKGTVEDGKVILSIIKDRN